MVNPIGSRLVKARVAASISQRRLAARAKVSQPSISAIERGDNRNPGALTLGRIERALGLPHGALSRPEKKPARKAGARGRERRAS